MSLRKGAAKDNQKASRNLRSFASLGRLRNFHWPFEIEQKTEVMARRCGFEKALVELVCLLDSSHP
jgi:hypothetical protein